MYYDESCLIVFKHIITLPSKLVFGAILLRNIKDIIYASRVATYGHYIDTGFKQLTMPLTILVDMLT